MTAAAAFAVLAMAHDFARHRFFTVDEYQYGHATWLVSEGRVPYVDFYEHHFPLAYVLHAPLLGGDAPFPERALRLRTIAFGWIAAVAIALGACTLVATRSLPLALLTLALSPALGFGLMSAVDYRADNVAGALWLLALAALEANRSLGRRTLAAGAGVLAALSVGSTQKMVFYAGGTIGLLLLMDFLAARRGAPERSRWVRFPGTVCTAGALVGALLLAIGWALGMLGPGFDSTLRFAVEHEANYPPVSVWIWLRPFLEATPASTALIVLGAAFVPWLGRPDDRFWWIALVLAGVGGLLIRAQFPYNYVLHGQLLMVCSLRGFAGLMRRVEPRVGALAPLLYLVPLALLPTQLAFLGRASDNGAQLALLAKIERLTEPGDAVIDGAGGALFRDHGSYYWYHGDAHRILLRETFETRLVDDYRDSRAPLWIDDFRQQKLPEAARAFLERHYVRVDGPLHALGFRAPRTGEDAGELRVALLRSGRYHVWPPVEADRGRSPLRIDGRDVVGGEVVLEAGNHDVRVAPGAPARLVTLVAPHELARPVAGPLPYTRLFEYNAR